MNAPAGCREVWTFPTARVGRDVLVFDELDSTNTLAARLGADGWPDGTAVVAKHQTAGRGRYGRVWQSRPGAALLLSVLLHPPPAVRRPAVLTAWAAVAVADAVYHLTSVQARIKWPNDVLVRGKKVCGILIEQAVDGPAVRTVVGIGLNLNQTADDFAGSGLPDATSLGVLTGATFDLRAAAGEVVARLGAEYARLLGGERDAVAADWAWRTGLLGRDVMVERTDGPPVVGRLVDMGFDGLSVDAGGLVPVVLAPETVAHVRLA